MNKVEETGGRSAAIAHDPTQDTDVTNINTRLDTAPQPLGSETRVRIFKEIRTLTVSANP